MTGVHLINQLLNEELCDTLPRFCNNLQQHYSNAIISSHVIKCDMISNELINEIKEMSQHIKISFGKTLRDIRCKIMDDEGIREHEIHLRFNCNNKLTVVDIKLPCSLLQDREYHTIVEVISAFHSCIRKLPAYFNELDNIDQECTVVEPIKPTYRDDFRRILLDGGNWLHIEVTPEGSARNVHLIRQSGQMYDKLQAGLLDWDHDKNIVDNIKCLADICTKQEINVEKGNSEVAGNTCGICFCINLEDSPGLPQPLCDNPNCDVYFHKNCLFQWLVASAGGRLPAFGVANGSCPTCLHPITCSEKDYL